MKKTKNASEFTQKAREAETMPYQPYNDMSEGCDFTDAEKNLSVYVSLVILEVFKLSKAYKGEKAEVTCRDTARLLKLIMDGLSWDLVPNVKFDIMAKSVHEALERVFGERLKDEIREQDQHEETLVIAAFQRKLKEHSGKLPTKFRCSAFSAVCAGIVVGAIVMGAFLALIIMLTR